MSATAGEGNVNPGRDRVAQTVPGQRGGEAQRCVGRSVSYLQEIRISLADRVSALVEAAAELLDRARSSQGGQLSIR